MCCGCLPGRYPVLGGDQQHGDGIGIALQRAGEITVRLVATSTRVNTGFWTVAEQFSKEGTESLSARDLRAALITAPFDENADAHQRVPPRCPLVHSCPRL